MTHPLLEKHRATLEGALAAIQTRGFWSAYPEQPSPKIYGETAHDEGKGGVPGAAEQVKEAADTGRVDHVGDDKADAKNKA